MCLCCVCFTLNSVAGALVFIDPRTAPVFVSTAFWISHNKDIDYLVNVLDPVFCTACDHSVDVLQLRNESLNRLRQWDMPQRLCRNVDDLINKMQLLILQNFEHCLDHRYLSVDNVWSCRQPCPPADRSHVFDRHLSLSDWSQPSGKSCTRHPRCRDSACCREPLPRGPGSSLSGLLCGNPNSRKPQNHPVNRFKAPL